MKPFGMGMLSLLFLAAYPIAAQGRDEVTKEIIDVSLSEFSPEYYVQFHLSENKGNPIVTNIKYMGNRNKAKTAVESYQKLLEAGAFGSRWKSLIGRIVVGVGLKSRADTDDEEVIYSSIVIKRKDGTVCLGFDNHNVDANDSNWRRWLKMKDPARFTTLKNLNGVQH